MCLIFPLDGDEIKLSFFCFQVYDRSTDDFEPTTQCHIFYQQFYIGHTCSQKHVSIFCQRKLHIAFWTTYITFYKWSMGRWSEGKFPTLIFIITIINHQSILAVSEHLSNLCRYFESFDIHIEILPLGLRNIMFVFINEA